MALRYSGREATVDDFIDNHLPCDQRFFRHWGKLRGPDPYKVFVGNPRTTGSYGCMAPVIQHALTSHIGNSKFVVNTSGISLFTLCRTYIDKCIPVILWATIEMQPIKQGNDWYLSDGSHYVWPSGEHCLLLVGYNRTHYFFNDPKTGGVVSYPHQIVEQRYAELGGQSLAVLPV